MSEIQLFPQVDRNRWSEDELSDAVQSASAHVQYLLRELAQAPSVPAPQLKSKKVAYAIVQRICNSKNKDPLVISRDENGERAYSINPDYRALVVPLVKDAPEPPESPAVPARPRRKSAGTRMRRGVSAVDGIADPSGSRPVRRIAQSHAGRSIAFPDDTPLAFCQELMAFLNATGSASNRYRIVLDAEGPRLEAI